MSVETVIQDLIRNGATEAEIIKTFERLRAQDRLNGVLADVRGAVTLQVADWDALKTFCHDFRIGGWTQLAPILKSQLLDAFAEKNANKLLAVLLLYAKLGIESSRNTG